MTSRNTVRYVAAVLICTWLPTMAWGATPPAALFNLSLNQVPVPEPANLFQFVKNKPAAIKLGKALFWDMQAGSDGVQACASCHFSAGADNRLKNTVNPGTRGGDTTFQVRGPNQTLLPTDFPFHQRQTPDFQDSQVTRDANDVVGSQGVSLADFVAITPNSAVEVATPVSDSVFQVNGANVRQVTARNTPSVINAVFNFNNFWDGRAHFIFNGVSPFGPQDTTAGVLFSDAAGNLTKRKIEIEMASLASQATGPALDTTEMSFRGRTFPQLGRKMLSLTPLGKQLVHPNDSVLGPLSRAVLANGKTSGQNGLSTTYEQMIKDAFLDTFWQSGQSTPDGFTQMEANFSLFWGLAIQLYEATLVSDQTPFDRLLGGDSNAITALEERGMNTFFGTGKCNLCHGGTELTDATASAALFITNFDNALIDQMPVASGQNTIYDLGYNSTGVRPMADDIARGGPTPFTNPLTGLPIPLGFSAMAELQARGNLPFQSIFLPPVPFDFPVSNNGAFKAPGLRNIELTGPYFHNGSARTLEEVVEFYARGGNFPSVTANPHLDFNMTQIGSLQGSPDKRAEMVAFLRTLTDERVKNESAPFDHPELFVPNGHLANGDTEFIKIPARDALGAAASTISLTLNPVASPTSLASQIIGGTKDVGTTSVTVSINSGSPSPADTVTDTTWSTTLTGLVEGTNSITVTATDSGGIPTIVSGSIVLDTVDPALTINAVATPTGSAAQIISGTVDLEPGVTLFAETTTAATVSPVTVVNGTWSAQVSGLTPGANAVGVAAIDPAGNFTLKMVTIYLSTPLTIADALKALKVSVKLIQPTTPDLNLLDVSPLVSGVPSQSGSIDISDSLLVLRKVVGLVTF